MSLDNTIYTAETRVDTSIKIEAHMFSPRIMGISWIFPNYRIVCITGMV